MATDWFRPWTMSGKALFWATRETTSESAKTVHMEEMVISSFHFRPMVEMSSKEISSVRAIISRKRPVPAAHLSFMTKLDTLPSGSTLMALLSWPPMSMTERMAGFRKWAPLAWQVISVTDLSPVWMTPRP